MIGILFKTDLYIRPIVHMDPMARHQVSSVKIISINRCQKRVEPRQVKAGEFT